MRKLALALVLFVAMFSLAGSADALMSFKVGPSFNMFSDTRISGIGTAFTLGFDLDTFSAGFKTEQQNLTLSDAQNSVNNFMLSNQLSALVIEKEVISVAKELPVILGLELGSLQMVGLAGSVAAPAGISQTVPVMGLNGGVKYRSQAKNIVTSLFVNIGYRFIDFRDTAIPGGFTAGGNNFKDLNGILVNAGVGIEF